MTQESTEPQAPIAQQPMQASITEQPDNTQQYTKDEKAVMELREEYVARINAHIFEVILPDLQATPSLRDGDSYVYPLTDRRGKPLMIDGSCDMSLDDVRRTSGFRSVQRLCDMYGWDYELNHFYHSNGAREANRFVMRFDGSCGAPTKSFQLRVGARAPRNPLTERSASAVASDTAP